MIILLRLKTWKYTVKSTTEHENVVLIWTTKAAPVNYNHSYNNEHNIKNNNKNNNSVNKNKRNNKHNNNRNNDKLQKTKNKGSLKGWNGS